MSRRIRTNAPIYFAHIPKTAGTSLTAWLDSIFAPHEVWQPTDVSYPGSPPPRIRLIRGHFWNGSGVVPATAQRVTVLRSPIDQFLSHFEHIRRNAKHRFNENALRVDRLTEILDDPMLVSQLWNAQTRFLAADIDRAGLERVHVDGHWALGIVHMPGNYVVNGAIANDLLLKLAIDHLDSYVAVGIVEQLELFAAALARLLGVARPTMPRLNVTKVGLSPRVLDEDEIAVVRSMTELDELLYRRARELQAQLVSEMLGAEYGHEPETDARASDGLGDSPSPHERELARLRATLAAHAEVTATLRFELEALGPHVEWLTGVKDRMHARLEELSGSRALRAVGAYWRTIDRLRGRRHRPGER